MKKVLLLFLLCFSLFKLPAHPVHVSVCNIEIENDSITLSIKLFLDDFQLALYHNYGQLIELTELADSLNYGTIDRYINKTLKICSGKNTSYLLKQNYSRTNEEAIWLNYRLKMQNTSKIHITNTLFLDIYSDQTNLVILNYKGKQNGYRFNIKNYEKSINLK